ncbi:hypothetical protein SK128_026601 [Halocaridina rubra]|uniref:t-SNARE coiled-coil homology domain-containing protein n=1 Tax=Halocaridina rubra TaxID=373956 RepID=A0AAN9ABM7_HALRR
MSSSNCQCICYFILCDFLITGKLLFRIDANVEDAELNVEAAHSELLKYFKSIRFMHAFHSQPKKSVLPPLTTMFRADV